MCNDNIPKNLIYTYMLKINKKGSEKMFKAFKNERFFPFINS